MKLPSGLVSQAERLVARVQVTVRLEAEGCDAVAFAWCFAITVVGVTCEDPDFALLALGLAASVWLLRGKARR